MGFGEVSVIWFLGAKFRRLGSCCDFCRSCGLLLDCQAGLESGGGFQAGLELLERLGFLL